MSCKNCTHYHDGKCGIHEDGNCQEDCQYFLKKRVTDLDGPNLVTKEADEELNFD